MRSMLASRRRAAAPSLGHRAAWALSAAAVGIALIPGAAPWAAPLFALAVAQWAWLAYGGKQPCVRGPLAAAHVADSMRSEALRKLIATSSRTAGNDLRALRADLRQVRGLVHDAAVTLGDGFQELGETMRQVRPSAGQEAVDGIEVLVRSLQFEDVARQLLEYCDHQVAGLESCADELAGLLGGSRQRVNVELKWLERQGLISVRPRGIEVHDAEGLQTLVDQAADEGKAGE